MAADYKPLCKAIEAGDGKRLKTLLNRDPEAARHWKPIMDAAFCGDPTLVTILLDAGADPNAVSGNAARHTPLIRILQPHSTIGRHDGHLQVLDLLRAAGADVDLIGGPHQMAPIQWAAMGGDERLVNWTLQQRPAINAHAAAALLDKRRLKTAIRRGQFNDEDVRGRTPLHFVAWSGMWKQHRSGSKHSCECVDLLLDAGADINHAESMDEGGEIFRATALWRAIGWQKHRVLAQHLLAHGADPDPAVFTATFEGDSGICDLLLAHGANFNQRFHGRTPLLEALHYRRAQIVPWLLANGADVSVADNNGMTALHHAALQGVRNDCIEALLEHGANPEARDNQGRTPLDRAREKNRTAAIELLGRHTG